MSFSPALKIGGEVKFLALKIFLNSHDKKTMWKPLLVLTVALSQPAFAGPAPTGEAPIGNPHVSHESGTSPPFKQECGESWDARISEKISDCTKSYNEAQIQTYLTAHHLPASDLVSVVAIKSKKTGKVVLPYRA